MRTARSGKIVVEHRPKSILPLSAAGKAAVRLHDDELDLFGIAEQVLGDLMRHIDLETDELAVVVDISEGRRGAVGGDDQLVALQHGIEQQLLRLGWTGEPKTRQQKAER